jgi:uncharacterized membrane protein
MRLVDAGAFMVTAIGVLVVNAVAAVLAGCALYGLQYAYRRYVRPSSESQISGSPAIAK